MIYIILSKDNAIPIIITVIHIAPDIRVIIPTIERRLIIISSIFFQRFHNYRNEFTLTTL